jgi:hypothetical protein
MSGFNGHQRQQPRDVRRPMQLHRLRRAAREQRGRRLARAHAATRRCFFRRRYVNRCCRWCVAEQNLT